jgi:hypothetical protein
MQAPLSPITITQSTAEPAFGAGGGGAGTGDAGTVGMRDTLSREHPVKATTTRTATPNFRATSSCPEPRPNIASMMEGVYPTRRCKST